MRFMLGSIGSKVFEKLSGPCSEPFPPVPSTARVQVLPNVVYRGTSFLLARVFAALHFAVDRFSALRGASLIKEKLRV